MQWYAVLLQDAMHRMGQGVMSTDDTEKQAEHWPNQGWQQ